MNHESWINYIMTNELFTMKQLRDVNELHSKNSLGFSNDFIEIVSIVWDKWTNNPKPIRPNEWARFYE